jgi:hypothetical protein
MANSTLVDKFFAELTARNRAADDVTQDPPQPPPRSSATEQKLIAAGLLINSEK